MFANLRYWRSIHSKGPGVHEDENLGVGDKQEVLGKCGLLSITNDDKNHALNVGTVDRFKDRSDSERNLPCEVQNDDPFCAYLISMNAIDRHFTLRRRKDCYGCKGIVSSGSYDNRKKHTMCMR
jgi:hypothetical protein